MFPKTQTWHKEAYRKGAAGEDCKMRLPGCFNQKETVVLAHCPGWLNKITHDDPIGIGKKGNDYNAVDACHYCHDILDGRDNNSLPQLITFNDRLEKQDFIRRHFEKGRYLTIINRIQRKILK